MNLSLDKSRWARVALGDVTIASKERCDPHDGSVERYVAGEHMDTDDLKVHRWGDVGEVDLGPAFHRRFRPGQVLYGSRRTYLRKVAVAEFDGVCANTTFVVETKDRSRLLQAFLPFVMTSEPFHAFALAESKGSVNPYVNWSDIERYEFDLPPLDEQQRMADLLWAVERTLRQALSSKVHISVASDLWLELALQIGVTQRGWSKLAVSQLVIAGPTNGKSATANDEGRGVPTLSISAIRGGKVMGGEAVKYIDVEPAQIAKFIIRSDDFLIVRGNGNKKLTGLGGLADGTLPDRCVYPDLLIRLRFDSRVLLPGFAAAQWNSQSAHSALIQKAKSTNGIWKINGQDVRSHELVVPPLEDQARLMDELETFDSFRASAHAEMESLKAIRGSLLGEIFGGP